MLRGLEGRRIALFAGDAGGSGAAAAILSELERHGARVENLARSTGEDWHGGRFAALVIAASPDAASNQLVQLVREFLLSDKPIAAFGAGATVLERAGGADADVVLIETGEGADAGEFARRAAAALARHLEEREVDEMSEQSFPASDPPSTTPSSVGRVRRDREPDTPP